MDNEKTCIELTICYTPNPSGGFTAHMLEVPGAVSEGNTKQEARENVLDALREILAFRRDEAMALGSERETLRLVSP